MALTATVLLSGCNYELQQNGAYAPHWDFWDSTNEFHLPEHP